MQSVIHELLVSEEYGYVLAKRQKIIIENVT